MKKKKHSTGVIDNSRARFDYEIEKTYLAGIALSCPEAKSLRFNHGVLRGSYIQIKDDGAYLINMQVNPLRTNIAHLPEQERTRTRRLLLKASELDELREAKNAGRQVVPLRLMTRSKFIKVEIGVGKGKKRYDKRQVLKKRDQERLDARKYK